MYQLSSRSKAKLLTTVPSLQNIIQTAMSWQVMDFAVICGVRTLQEQKDLVEKGFSRTLNSKHLPNAQGLSQAIDIAPYPIDWSDHKAFHRLAGIIQAAASQRNIDIRWGGDWDGDNDTHDQSFIDLPHFEIRSIH